MLMRDLYTCIPELGIILWKIQVPIGLLTSSVGLLEWNSEPGHSHVISMFQTIGNDAEYGNTCST